MVMVAACARESAPRDTTAAVSADTASAASAAGAGGAAGVASTLCDSAARDVVQRFGARMRMVSVLAPEATVRPALARVYGDLVTPTLLAQWQNAPRSAPGKDVSSPWPARIAVSDIAPDGAACVAHGDLIAVVSADTATPLERRPITVRLTRTDRWRVAAYEAGAPSRPNTPGAASPPRPTEAAATDTTPADVVRQYYADIQARNYPAAFALWGRHGAASGTSAAEFARGFADTKSVAVTIGDSIVVEGAAGSQYATVPASVDAVLSSGIRQRFAGTYTLRRVMVDGASAEERRWHIDRADLHRVRD